MTRTDEHLDAEHLFKYKEGARGLCATIDGEVGGRRLLPTLSSRREALQKRIG